MTPRCASRAAALLIGDELLSGKVKEANLYGLAQTLSALGIVLVRVVIVRDEAGAIARELRELSQEFDLVVTSGGVGPTHDDVTIDAVALAFGAELTEDETIVRLLERTYGPALTPAHRRMARVPKGAGLATTEGVEWPTVVYGNVWLFPGVPEFFRMKLDVLRAWVRGPCPFHSRAVYTRIDEPKLAPLLDSVVAAFPQVAVGSYPKWFDESYKTKITFDGTSREAVEGAMAEFMSRLAAETIARVE